MKSIYTKVLSILLVFGLVIPSFLFPLNIAKAQGDLPLGSTVTDLITPQEKSKLYNVTLTEAGRLTINISAYFDDVKFNLYDTNNTTILSKWIYYGQENNPSKYEAMVNLEPGQYSIEITGIIGNDDAVGKFNLSTSFNPAKNNENEPNNGTDIAQTLPTKESEVKGFISWSDNIDYYKVVLPSAGKLNLQIASYFDDMTISLIDENGDSAITQSIYYGRDNDPKKWNNSVDLEPGTYFIKISGGNEVLTSGAYYLNTNFSPAGNNEQEPNNGTDLAQLLKINDTVNGYLSWNDSEDDYKFEVTQSTNIKFEIWAYLEMSFELYNSDQERLIEKWIYYGVENDPTKWEEEITLEPGTYYVKLHKATWGYSTGKYKFATKNLSSYKEFKDVSGNYINPVNYLVENQIASGLSDSIFGVNVTIKRVDAAVMIAKALKLNLETNYNAGFKDVPVRAQKAVNALVENGVISGKAKDRFGSNENLTRGEMALILTRAYHLNGDGVNVAFKDVTDRYKDAVQALIKNEITQGKTETLFGTTNPITRGEMAIFLYRVENR